jgi:hypothetical protein
MDDKELVPLPDIFFSIVQLPLSIPLPHSAEMLIVTIFPNLAQEYVVVGIKKMLYKISMSTQFLLHQSTIQR